MAYLLDTHALIAGQARVRGMGLVTRYTDEFARVPGLRIEDWEVGRWECAVRNSKNKLEHFASAHPPLAVLRRVLGEGLDPLPHRRRWRGAFEAIACTRRALRLGGAGAAPRWRPRLGIPARGCARHFAGDTPRCQ